MSKLTPSEEAMRDIIAEIVTPQETGEMGEYLLYSESQTYRRIVQIARHYQARKLK